MTINLFDFENADIARLAIHIRETLWTDDTVAVDLSQLGPVPQVIYGGAGWLLGATLFPFTAGAWDALFWDGATADDLFVAAVNGLTNTGATLTIPNGGFPFTNGLTFQDANATKIYVGQAFIRPARPRR